MRNLRAWERVRVLGRCPDRSTGAGVADSSQMAGLGPGGEVGTARQVRAPGRLLPGLRDIALQRRGQHPWVPAASPIVAQALCDLAPTDPSSLKCPLRRPSSGGSNSVRQLGAGPSSPLGRPDAAHRVPPCVPLTGRCSRPFAGPSVPVRCVSPQHTRPVGLVTSLLAPCSLPFQDVAGKRK